MKDFPYGKRICTIALQAIPFRIISVLWLDIAFTINILKPHGDLIMPLGKYLTKLPMEERRQHANETFCEWHTERIPFA